MILKIVLTLFFIIFVEKLWIQWLKHISKRFSMGRCLYLMAARTSTAETHFRSAEKRSVPFFVIILLSIFSALMLVRQQEKYLVGKNSVPTVAQVLFLRPLRNVL